MSEPDSTIPLRELRNDVSEVLRQVQEEGRTIRVTVRGMPAADLVPISERRTWVARQAIETLLRGAPLDAAFAADVAAAMGSTTDEIEAPWTD